MAPTIPTFSPRSEKRRLLLVAYAFPPVGGAGVQRPLKWVKYLHRAGWQVTVLTPRNPSVPVRDDSLLEEVPEETVFLRPKTLEPSYRWKSRFNRDVLTRPRKWLPSKQWLRAAIGGLLQPDPQILWYPQAVSFAERHLRQVSHEVILVTAPPFSSFLIGTSLRRRCRLPLILDYRDEWDLSNQYLEHASRGVSSQFIQERMQRYVLRLADAVIATTQASKQRLQEKIQQVQGHAQAVCIYNGYDEEDLRETTLTSSVPPVPDGCFRLVYTGTLWNLTSLEPLAIGLELLHRRSPDLASRVELVCVGRKTLEQRQYLERLKQQTSCRVLDISYLPHEEIIPWLRSADALCLLLTDAPGAERVVPAKLFEYLALRKPIMGLLPEGESSQLVEEYAQAGFFLPQSPVALADWLGNALSKSSPPAWKYPSVAGNVEVFRRDKQTERLLAVMENVTQKCKAAWGH